MLSELIERVKQHPIVALFGGVVAFHGGILVLINFCDQFQWCQDTFEAQRPVVFVSSFLKTTGDHVRLVKHLRATGATIEEAESHTCQKPNATPPARPNVNFRYSDPKWEPAIRKFIDAAVVHFAGLYNFPASTKVVSLSKPVDIEVYAGHNPQGNTPRCVP